MLLARWSIKIVGAKRANSLAASQTFRRFPAFAIARLQRGKAVAFVHAGMKKHLPNSALAKPATLHRTDFHAGISRVIHIAKVYEAGDKPCDIRRIFFAPAAFGNLAREILMEFCPRRRVSGRIVQRERLKSVFVERWRDAPGAGRHHAPSLCHSQTAI